jgi:hypothetical protein
MYAAPTRIDVSYITHIKIKSTFRGVTFLRIISLVVLFGIFACSDVPIVFSFVVPIVFIFYYSFNFFFLLVFILCNLNQVIQFF